MTTSNWTPEKQKLLAWSLGSVVTLLSFVGTTALGVGAWAFVELRGEAQALGVQAEGLKDSINALKTQVAVLTQQQSEVAAVRADLRAHKAELGHPHGVAAMVESLGAEVKALRAQVRDHFDAPGHALTVDRLSELRARVDEIERTRFTKREGDALQAQLDKLKEHLPGPR